MSNTRAVAPEAAAVLHLTDLMVSGEITALHANADGSWTVTSAHGATVTLTGTAQVVAYVDRATTSTGPQALAPARVALPARPPASADEEDSCGCVPGTAGSAPVEYGPDLMQARAILRLLAKEFAISSHALSTAYDEAAQAAVVRIQTSHGLYALHIPAIGRQYVVYRNGGRDGVINARRVPATTDTTVTLLTGAYLRDRGAL
ncbi:hypothetical protein [Streptomyces sp. JL7001]|uniref:hypothetical protein n=1 Tax=Streptomyces sp. JL7001 TaxID=3445784 RepID=UPI003F7B1144